MQRRLDLGGAFDGRIALPGIFKPLLSAFKTIIPRKTVGLCGEGGAVLTSCRAPLFGRGLPVALLSGGHDHRVDELVSPDVKFDTILVQPLLERTGQAHFICSTVRPVKTDSSQ